MKKLGLLFGILIFASGVFADISISEPDEVYNLGDRLYIDLAGLRGTENGNLDINLVCGNLTINMVRIPARAFAQDEDQSYSVPYKVLDWEDLGILDLDKIIGDCQVVVKMGGEASSGKVFEVSDKVYVDVTLDRDSYDPGETVNVGILARKPNGAMLNGFAQGMNGTSFNEEVVDGGAETSFVVGATAEAGTYLLKVKAYDVGDVGILNSGQGSVSYVVNQVPTSLILSLEEQNVIPGNNFSIGVEAFDQSGVSIQGNIFVKIVSPDGGEIESVVSSGEFADIDFLTNSTVGTWKIMAAFDEMAVEREFEMMALQKVEFDFEESVLVVKNVGNVVYNKSIEVNIGEDVMSLELNIEPGQVRKFSLNAPVGTYDVKVGDGESEVIRTVLLTGKAISVSDFRGGGFFKNYTFLWIFFIVIFGGIGLVLFMRYRKTKTLKEDGFFSKVFSKVGVLFRFGSKTSRKVSKNIPRPIKSNMDSSLNFTKKSPEVHGFNDIDDKGVDRSMVDYTRKSTGVAESSLVLKGEKNVSGIVCISVKNFEDLSDVAKAGLRGIVEKHKGKGLVDYREEFIFVVFSPLITRTYHNERLAVEASMKFFEDLNVYNKKFKDKVIFGIGVHAGDLVASKEGGKLKYTGIGNTISLAKRISDLDSGKVVVSEGIRKKLVRDLKMSEGKNIGEKKTYAVSSLIDRAGDKEKLRQLLKRQG